MKVFIEMSEKFAYFSIFAKTHHRFICISRDSFYKLMDYKHVFKTKKNYSKNPYSNKWEENNLMTAEEIKRVNALLSKAKGSD